MASPENGAGPRISDLPVGMRVSVPVFLTSVLLIFLFIVFTLNAGKDAEGIFSDLKTLMAKDTGWFFILTANLLLLFSLFLLFSPFGRLRLGGVDAKPEFSTWGWLAMLFSAGMGIGLVFWAVAEPLYHYGAPPLDQLAEPGKHSRAEQAMGVTFLHWGLHPWAIYAVLGLGLAYASFNRGLPLSVRSLFQPMLGDRIYGFWGHVIDILAVLATLFGVATSLGLGVSQVGAGLDKVFGTGQSLELKLALIAGITAIATISVVTGVKKGIRFLSELNMILAGCLLLAVLFFGPTLFLLNGYIENIGYYIQHFPRLATWTETYTGTSWQDSWTVFYYAWWISWSPFVGMFIARISKGRTVREFILAVLIVPTLIGFAWLNVFGGSALFTELFGAGGLTEALKGGAQNALFALLENMPLAFWTSLLATIVVITFFVTSSDSGSLVIDMIAAGGDPNPPVAQRVFWATTEGIVAATLLIGGGLTALQTASVTTGLPFALVLILSCFGLYRWLAEDAASLPR